MCIHTHEYICAYIHTHIPFPGDLPDPGIEPRSPALQTDALPSELHEFLMYTHTHINIYVYTYTHKYMCVYIHTHTGMLLSHKKNEIMSFAATLMDLEIIIPSEISPTEKDKNHIKSLIKGI